MIANMPPALIMVLGALLIPLVRNKTLRAGYMLLLPVLGFVQTMGLEVGTLVEMTVFSYQLKILHVDKISIVFSYIFHIAAFITIIYSLHADDNVQYVSGLIYAGSAIGAVFAGDLITLFIYWELTAVSSVFLIWARRSQRAYSAGMRYLVVQVLSGLLLLAGTIMYYRQTGNLDFMKLGQFTALGLKNPAAMLIFLAFGIKAAFPFLHNWLEDAYPEATEVGTVFLSSFTTKLAIYALARGFLGTPSLIWIGATMTAFPIFYAVIENDLRRVLAYSLNNQLGYMVVGIGIGTELALNGTVAHAFTHILYKSLLFMSMGAVLYRTGTCNGSDLGGLYKSMPYTTIFCCIGAASISAFPLFSGFVSKSMILSAAAGGHFTIVWLVLLFASAGVFHHSGIKIPFFAFFAHDSGIRCKEAPTNMLIAMGIASALCILIGVFPGPLYELLPYKVTAFEPYTTSHVITQLQLLMFSALAFVFLQKTGVYPPELRSVVLDTDWTYRKLLPNTISFVRKIGGTAWQGLLGFGFSIIQGFLIVVRRNFGTTGVFARTMPTGHIVLWAALFLCGYIFLYYLWTGVL